MLRLFISVPVFVLIFLVTANASAASLTLQWDPPSDSNTAGHMVIYGTAPGSYGTKIDVGAATKTVVSGLTARTRYCFVVQAYNRQGQLSPVSGEVCGTTPDVSPVPVPPAPVPPAPVPPAPVPPVTAPAPPAPVPAPVPPVQAPGKTPGETLPAPGLPNQRVPHNLTAQVREDRFIDLAWSAPASGSVTGYRLEVGTAAGHTAISSVTTQLSSTFTLADLPATGYYIRVKALSNGSFGEASDETFVKLDNPLALPPPDTTPQCAAPPGAPVRFAATAEGARVQLSWSPGTGSSTTGYYLQVGSAPGYQDLMTVPMGAGNTTLVATAANGRYALRLVGVNACGASNWGPESILVVGTPAAQIPGAPETLSGDVAGGRVSLAWMPPAGGDPVTYYVLEVMSAGGPLALNTGTASTVFAHENTPAGEYVIRVRAGNAAGIGPASTAVTIVVP